MASPVIEHLPGGGVRTYGTADRAMTRRMGYAQYASTRWLWWSLGPALVLGPAVYRFLERPREGISLINDLALPMVMGAVVFGSFVVGVLYLTGPDYWRLYKLPPGTPIYVDATPDWVGIGWREKYTALSHSYIEQLSEHKSVLVITGRGNKMYVPRELLPTETAAALLSMTERNDEAGLVAANVVSEPPRAPFLTDLGGPRGEVIQTRTVADSALAERLARSVRRTSALRTTLLLTLPLPIAAVIALLVDSERNLVGSMFLSLMGIGIAIFCIIGYYVFVGAAANLRKLVPEGTTVAAEFGPDALSVRFGGYLQAFGLARISKIEDVGEALVLTVRGAAEDERSARRSSEGVLIPAEVVPPHVAETLLARFG